MRDGSVAGAGGAPVPGEEATDAVVMPPREDAARVGAVVSAGQPSSGYPPVDSPQRPETVPNRRAIGARTSGRAAIQAPAMTIMDAKKSQNPVQLSA